MRRLGWPRRGLRLGSDGLACVLNCMDGFRDMSSASAPVTGRSSGLAVRLGVALLAGAGESLRACIVGEMPLILS